MEESRWKKHVTWDDPEEIEAKYEELSSKIDTVLNPLSISEFKSSAYPEKQMSKYRTSGEALKKELDFMSIIEKPSTPSKSLQMRHEKLQSERKDMQIQCGDLVWTDVISNAETRSFLEQYFPKSSSISTIDFLAFLEFEYPHFINSESVKEEIVNMLALNKKSGSISLNALELLTRESGLESFVHQIFLRVDEEIKENKAQINNEILQEVTEIKEMLDLKAIELDKKEAKILARENKLIRLENTLIAEFRGKLEKIAGSIKEKLSKEIATQMKRMQGLERNLSDMIKLARSKQQILTRSELSMKSSGRESSENKFKARITSLEKSNECMKTKLSLLELESKSDKITIAKLNEDISRIKARNSMLEQSLSTAKKVEPEKIIIEAPVLEKKEEPNKENLTMSAELVLSFSIITTLINCCKLTLPIVNGPPSPKSVSLKVSVFEENETSLGELFFPAFNVLVPGLIESIPFVHKLKKKEDQEIIIKLLWDLLMYAWCEEMPVKRDRKFYPNNLQFNPTTHFWKQKMSNSKIKISRKPVYQVFTNLLIHKIFGNFLLKWMNTKAKFSMENSLLAGFLLVLTSCSNKKIIVALNFIKDSISVSFDEKIFKGCIGLLAALLEYPDEIGEISCGILLSLAFSHLSAVISQCCNETTVNYILEACKKAVVNGLKSGKVTEIEESLIVLLEMLSRQEFLQINISKLGIDQLLIQRLQTVSDNSFFQNNINSILQNIRQ